MENRSETAPPGKPRSEATIAFALLLLLTLVAASPLLGTGWYISHEFSSPLQRAYALAHEIRAGTLYPRWLSLTAFNFGTPFFNFYSPGFYLVTAYLNVAGAGLLDSLKFVTASHFLLGGVAMYLWTRRHYTAAGALTAAILYLFAPYHFLNAYVRGALSEFAAHAYLPFLFLGFDLAIEESSRLRGPILTALASGAIVLCHNLSALMIAPFALLYLAARARQAEWECRPLANVALGLAAGAGLSAFYWLPLAAEMKYLHDLGGILTSGYNDYRNHFVELRQLASTYWGYGASMEGPGDELGFQLGVATLLFCAGAGATLFFIRGPARRHALLTLGLALFGLGMTSAVAGPLYRLFTPLAYVQFPWRFLGPASLFLAAFGGFLAESPVFSRLPGHLGRAAPVAAAALLCVALSGQHREVKTAPDAEWYNSSARLDAYFMGGPEMSCLCNESEYLPRGVPRLPEKELQALAFDYPRGDGLDVAAIEWPTPGMVFSTNAGSRASEVALPIFWFPGWEVRLDGARTAVHAGEGGLLTFHLPAGALRVEAYFGTTPPRIFGWALTVATLVLGGGLCALTRRDGGTGQ